MEPVPAPRRKPGCGLCGHPRALHRSGTSPCRAFACTAAADGGPCPGWMTAEQAAAYRHDGTLPEPAGALAV
jgi:hypothetical protein